MASLKLSLSLDTLDTTKFTKPRPLTTNIHVSKSSTAALHSFNKASRFDTFSANDDIKEKSSHFDSRASVKRRNKRSPREKIESLREFESQNSFLNNVKEKRSDIESEVNGKRRNKRYPSRKIESSRGFGGQNLFLNNGELDVDYSVIGDDMGIEECNAILRRLERSGSDGNALRFFEWMRTNGKLEGNVDGYCLVLRVLSRLEDWDGAEELVRGMNGELSGCELSYRVFNTVIYACSKKGSVEVGSKWFRMMLEYGVMPNVATIGMLMGLYRKGWNVEGAEFAFSVMRKFGIKCESSYSAMITIYTRLRLYDKAEEIIRVMREDGVVSNLENWLVMLNAYCQQGKSREAEMVFVGMQEAGFLPNLVAYNTMITGYGKVSNMDAAQRLFEGLEDVGLGPDETTYRSMIEGWGRGNNYEQAKWYYEELMQLGLKPNASNMYTLLNLQAKHGNEEGALTTLDQMISMGCQYSSVLGILLQAYKSAGRINKVPLLLKGSLYQQVLVNQNSCSTLVMEYVKNCLVDEAINVLRDKQWKDPVFEVNLYHLLICSCKELGYLENAVKIYTSMPKSYDKPNLHITSTMIDVYCTMGCFAEAENIYLKLKASGILLDLIAYSVIVRMYVKAGSLKDACSVLDEMDRQKGIVPDMYLFRDMLRIYQQCGMQKKLTDLYSKILKSGITWDQELYNCVINCCARALPVDELSRVFDEMLQKGFTPNTFTVNVMLDVYGKSRLFSKAKGLFEMARKQGLTDTISYNTLIAAFGKNKDFENMLLYVKKMQFSGFLVSLEAYNCMLDAYGKEGQMENFRGVLQKMKGSGCSSDNYTYNTMFNIYGEERWIDEVAKVLSELKECGREPDLCGYNTLIKAYGLAGMVEDAVSLIKEMREKGIEPDHITYINLITALQRNDKFLEAVKWSLWMKQINLCSERLT